MTQLLIDRLTAAPTRPRSGKNASDQARNRPGPQRQGPAEHAGGAEGVRDRNGAPAAPERPSAEARRQRSKALARQLESISTVEEFVVLAQEHGRLPLVRAATGRPDLIPEVNGEFAHIALSLADLD